MFPQNGTEQNGMELTFYLGSTSLASVIYASVVKTSNIKS